MNFKDRRLMVKYSLYYLDNEIYDLKEHLKQPDLPVHVREAIERRLTERQTEFDRFSSYLYSDIASTKAD